jgi:hypothetical protein
MSTVPVPEFFSATTTFTTEIDVDGQATPVVVHRGENVAAGHPLIVANPQYFAPVEVASRWDVAEQATAAPGEKRTVGRRHKPVGVSGVPRDPRGTSDPVDPV